MSSEVGIRDLRQNLSAYLRRVESGERFTVTDRNRPVADLTPLREPGGAVSRLVAEGRLVPPRESLDAFLEREPIKLEGGMTLGEALEYVREDSA